MLDHSWQWWMAYTTRTEALIRRGHLVPTPYNAQRWDLITPPQRPFAFNYNSAWMYDRRLHSAASKPCMKCVHAQLYQASPLTALPAAMYHICRKQFLLHLTNGDALCTVHHNFCHEHEQAATLQRRRAGQSKAHDTPSISGQLSLVKGDVARRAAGGSRQVCKVSQVHGNHRGHESPQQNGTKKFLGLYWMLRVDVHFQQTVSQYLKTELTQLFHLRIRLVATRSARHPFDNEYVLVFQSTQ